MKVNKLIRKNSKRILALSLTLCIFLAMFAGCDFSSSDTCTDPNCTSCAIVVYAAEYPDTCIDPDCDDCVSSIAYIDCPDCVGGGVYVTSDVECLTCNGSGEITTVVWVDCTAIGCVDGYSQSSTICGDCLGVGTIFTLCTNCGGDSVTDDDRACNVCTSGYVSTTCITCGGDGEVESYGLCSTCYGLAEVKTYVTSDCSTCGGDGSTSSTTYVLCTTCNGYGGWTEEAGTGCEECDYLGLVDCPMCDGYGYYDFGGVNYTCSYCGGTDQRVDSSGSVTGSGKIPCSYCSEDTYYDVTYINSYGAECTVYVAAGEILPSYPSLGQYYGSIEDDYWFTSDEAGNNIISKSSTVTSDMTVYVHFINDETDEVEYVIIWYYEYYDGFWFFNSWRLAYSLPVITGSVFSEVNTYYTDSIYQLTYDKDGVLWVYDTDVISESVDMYVHYSATVADPQDPHDPSSSTTLRDTISGWFSGDFMTESPTIIIIVVVLVAVMLLVVIFK